MYTVESMVPNPGNDENCGLPVYIPSGATPETDENELPGAAHYLRIIGRDSLCDSIVTRADMLTTLIPTMLDLSISKLGEFSDESIIIIKYSGALHKLLSHLISETRMSVVLTKEEIHALSSSPQCYRVDKYPLSLVTGYRVTFWAPTLQALVWTMANHLSFHRLEPSSLALRPSNLNVRSLQTQPCPSVRQQHKHPPVPLPTNPTRAKILQLTKREVTFLIGKNGERISAIRAGCGALIKILPLDDAPQIEQGFLHPLLSSSVKPQCIRVSGTAHQISVAVSSIEKCIFDYRNGVVRY